MPPMAPSTSPSTTCRPINALDSTPTNRSKSQSRPTPPPNRRRDPNRRRGPGSTASSGSEVETRTGPGAGSRTGRRGLEPTPSPGLGVQFLGRAPSSWTDVDFRTGRVDPGVGAVFLERACSSGTGRAVPGPGVQFLDRRRVLRPGVEFPDRLRGPGVEFPGRASGSRIDAEFLDRCRVPGPGAEFPDRLGGSLWWVAGRGRIGRRGCCWVRKILPSCGWSLGARGGGRMSDVWGRLLGLSVPFEGGEEAVAASTRESAGTRSGRLEASMGGALTRPLSSIVACSPGHGPRRIAETPPGCRARSAWILSVSCAQSATRRSKRALSRRCSPGWRVPFRGRRAQRRGCRG